MFPSTPRFRSSSVPYLTMRRPPYSTLFPYTTLFRSLPEGRLERHEDQCAQGGQHAERRRRRGVRSGRAQAVARPGPRSEEHTSELQSHSDLVCRLLLEKKNSSEQHAPALEPRSDTVC